MALAPWPSACRRSISAVSSSVSGPAFTLPDPAALTGTALHQYLVLRGGMRAEEGAIEWLTEVLEVL